MAKTRLNGHHRDMLTAFAEKAVECKSEQRARDKAYERAEKAVIHCIEKQFPADDMAVLAKYDLARTENQVNGGDPNGASVHFTFDGGDANERIPPRPRGRNHYYSDAQSVSFDAKTKDLIDSYDLAQHALDEARNKKLTNYKALIRTAVTFEDVLDVWPAAAVLSEKIKRQQTSLVVLSADVIANIRADNAGAKMEAEAIGA